MGKPSDIDYSLANIWHSWWNFRAGKRSSPAILAFEWQLEGQLTSLQRDIALRRYKHGSYDHFIVNDSKRRDIAVANVRDRIVHRLLYDYLVKVCDKRFDYDVWSCRVGKGNSAAVKRAGNLLRKYSSAYVWRGDVQKFFDNVDQQILTQLLSRYKLGNEALFLLNEVIGSYSTQNRTMRGIPIGNLTSQILANVYLHEFDFFVRQELKPLAYMRYGDDFLVISSTKLEALHMQSLGQSFLANKLRLELHSRNNLVIPVSSGVKYLGVTIYPNSVTLPPKVMKDIHNKQSLKNINSYTSYVMKYGNRRQRSTARLWLNNYL